MTMTTFRMSTITGMNKENAMYQFGFIGMGNMGSAMLKGSLSVFPAEKLAFSRKDAGKGEAFAKETGTCFLTDNEICARQSKYVILAVKPQFYEEVLAQIRPVLTEEKIIISLAPNYLIADLKALLGNDIRVLRAMPNTPSRVGEGMTAIVWSDDYFSEEERKDIHRFFTSFGKVENISENMMDAVTAASGSSPAFFYMMIEALADGVVQYGMPRAKAYTFVAQSVLGAAKMVLETGEHPGALKDSVCSPGGTTIAGVASLEASGFRNSLIQAASAVYERCQDMRRS